jgi:predicted transcriptional regulator YdeE
MQTIQPFHIIGVSVRTTNENRKAEEDIPALWGAFMGRGAAEAVPNRIDDTVYCAYTDYESDYTKAYTVVIGCAVPTLDAIPDEMVGITVPGGTYETFVAKGNVMQGVVQDTWEKIWASDLRRAYTTDYDVYGERAKNIQDAEVDVFVSVK